MVLVYEALGVQRKTTMINELKEGALLFVDVVCIMLCPHDMIKPLLSFITRIT